MDGSPISTYQSPSMDYTNTTNPILHRTSRKIIRIALSTAFKRMGSDKYVTVQSFRAQLMPYYFGSWTFEPKSPIRNVKERPLLRCGPPNSSSILSIGNLANLRSDRPLKHVTYSARVLMQIGQQPTLAHTFEMLATDVCCFSETRILPP